MPKVTRGRTSTSMVRTARINRMKMTLAESILWQALRNGQMGGLKFRKQHPVGNYILDFFCAEEMLAVEVDGSIHAAHEQRELDQERTEWLQAKDIRVLRFANEVVCENLPSVLEQIRSFIAQHPLRKNQK